MSMDASEPESNAGVGPMVSLEHLGTDFRHQLTANLPNFYELYTPPATPPGFTQDAPAATDAMADLEDGTRSV
jgi:hypothetical protein